MQGILSVCGKGDGAREKGEGGCRRPGAGESKMLQGKKIGVWVAEKLCW